MNIPVCFLYECLLLVLFQLNQEKQKCTETD